MVNEFTMMKDSCAIIKGLFLELSSLICPGISCSYIDDFSENYIRNLNAHPAFLGYGDFPGTCCISVNDCVVHGAPSNYVLEEGDIVSIDCGAVKDGYFSDACRTFPVGEVSGEDAYLIFIAEQCLLSGISSAVPGNRIGDISYSIQSIAEKAGFSIPLDFVGHSIGKQLHMEPWVPNYGPSGKGPLIEEGMFLAIEPVVMSGKNDIYQLSTWEIFSLDGKKSAHVEDTIYISSNGPVVLTR